MGQQQLLLLALGIIVVGISVVGSTTAFTENKDKSDFDMITSEAIKIAADIMAWKARPATMGGGEGSSNLSGLTFAALGYETTNGSGSKANSSDFFRTLKNTTTARPFVIIRPRKNPTVRVQLFLYGAGEKCFKVRRSQKVDGKWVNAPMAVGVNKVPEGCTGW